MKKYLIISASTCVLASTLAFIKIKIKCNEKTKDIVTDNVNNPIFIENNHYNTKKQINHVSESYNFEDFEVDKESIDGSNYTNDIADTIIDIINLLF